MSQEAVVSFLKRLDEDAQLKKQFFETVPPQISSGAPIVAFAGAHGFKFTEDDLKQASSALQPQELSEAEAAAVVGGAMTQQTFQMGSLGYRVLQNYTQLGNLGKVAV